MVSRGWTSAQMAGYDPKIGISMGDAASNVLARGLLSPPGGWAPFVDRYWGREPAVYRGAFDGSFVDSARVHRVLCAAGKKLRSGEKVRARVFIERGNQDDTGSWLPLRERTLAAYARRLSKGGRGRDFTVLLNGGAAHDPVLYARCRSLLRGLNEHAGVSMLNDAVVYMSAAGRSTFGVHQDPDHNFLFIVEGKKRFRVFRPGTLEMRPDLVRSQRYGAIVKHSRAFDVGPGDLLYIPAGAFHVAESGQGLAVHLSLLVNDDPDTSFRLVSDAAYRIAHRARGNARSSGILRLKSPSNAARKLVLPPELAEAGGAYAALGRPFDEALLAVWAERLSGFGFRDVPPLRAERSLDDRRRVGIDRESGFLVHRNGAHAFFAANGHMYRIAAHPRVLAMLAALGSGELAAVADWVALGEGVGKVGRARLRATPKYVRALLVMLDRMRALKAS